MEALTHWEGGDPTSVAAPGRGNGVRRIRAPLRTGSSLDAHTCLPAVHLPRKFFFRRRVRAMAWIRVSCLRNKTTIEVPSMLTSTSSADSIVAFWIVAGCCIVEVWNEAQVGGHVVGMDLGRHPDADQALD